MNQEIQKHAIEGNCKKCLSLLAKMEVYYDKEENKVSRKEALGIHQAIKEMYERMCDEHVKRWRGHLEKMERAEKIGFEQDGEAFRKTPIYKVIQREKVRAKKMMSEKPKILTKSGFP